MPEEPIRERAHVGKTPWFVLTKAEMLVAANGMPPGIREAFIARVEREMPDDSNS